VRKLYFLIVGTVVILAASIFSARPVQAANLFDLWGDVTCVTDIDCTVQAAATSAGNYVVHSAVGKDFEDITGDDVVSMLRGKWDKGLASAVGEIGGLAYSFTTPRFEEYVREELADNLLTNPANAQVSGEGALLPIRDIWSRVRNIAYGLFAVVMIAIGVMIILQREISPRVVITFTNALPKIILSLVLITFSFPIIALLIDVGAVFGGQLVLRVVEGVFKPIGELAGSGLSAAISLIPVALIGVALSGLAGIGTNALAALLIAVVFILVTLVLTGMFIIRAIINYGWILAYTIFSPILILFGSLPGQEEGVATLFKNVLAKTLVFPVMLFFAVFGLGLATSAVAGASESFFTGTFGNLISGAALRQTLLGGILGLVMLAAAFKAPELVENAMGVGGKKGGKK